MIVPKVVLETKIQLSSDYRKKKRPIRSCRQGERRIGADHWPLAKGRSHPANWVWARCS